MRAAIDESKIGDMVRQSTFAECGVESLLLPMAFPEGSPMHPSYGAGHAAVAGACVTILKAFFDHTQPFDPTGSTERDHPANIAFVANSDGSALEQVPVVDARGNPATLTVEGELNKLAANISIGRDWAGVHYFSDYWESLLMGEQIAIGILREQKLCFTEDFTMTIPRFGGGTDQAPGGQRARNAGHRVPRADCSCDAAWTYLGRGDNQCSSEEIRPDCWTWAMQPLDMCLGTGRACALSRHLPVRDIPAY